MILLTNNPNITFDGFEHFYTNASKHSGLISECFNSKKIEFNNPKSNKTVTLEQVECKLDATHNIPEEWIYHDYNKDNGRNIVLHIYNN